MLHQNWFCNENMIMFYEVCNVKYFYDTDSKCFYGVSESASGISINEHDGSAKDLVYPNLMFLYEEFLENNKFDLTEKLQCTEVYEEDEDGIYFHSEYYGADIYVHKKSKEIYELTKCQDILVCLIDYCETIDNFYEEGIRFIIPVTIINADCTYMSLIKDVNKEICMWENNPETYQQKELKMFTNSKKGNI